jgi:hypothetical protein
MRRRRPRSRLTHRHRRWSHGKYFRSVTRRPPRRHRRVKSSASRSAGHHRSRRHRWGRPCWASGCLQSADRQEGSRLRRRSGHSDRSGRHSGHRRSDRRHWHRRFDHRTGRRLARHHYRRHRLASHHPASRRSFHHRRSACSSRRLASRRCYPTKRKIGSRRPGSASKRRRRRCCHRPKACSTSCLHHLSCLRKSRCSRPKNRRRSTAKMARAWMTIAAVGSRPSGIRRLRRLQSPVRQPRAETCASAEYASFLLVPPPHRRGLAPS